MEKQKEYFEIIVQDFHLLDQAQAIGSQMVSPSPSLAPFVFTLLNSLPAVDNNGRCFSYRILQKSIGTVSQNIIDLEHLGVNEGPGIMEDPGPTEILGHMIGAELATIPDAPPIPSQPVPLKIYGVLYKRRAIARKIINDILSEQRDWRISMEVIRNIKEDAILWGNEFILMEKASSELIEIARQRSIGNYQGKSVALAIGGAGEGNEPTSVYFWGAGLTLKPAAQTEILALAASAGPHSEIILQTDGGKNMEYDEWIREQWEIPTGIEIGRWISVAEENKMPDSHFLWVRGQKTGDKSKDRKLPYKWPDGRLSRPGLRGAWNALHGARGGVDLQGGPGKEAMLAKCRRAIAQYNREHPDDAINIKESQKGGIMNLKEIREKFGMAIATIEAELKKKFENQTEKAKEIEIAFASIKEELDTMNEFDGWMGPEDVNKKIEAAVAKMKSDIQPKKSEDEGWMKAEDVDKKVEAAVASVKAEFARKETRRQKLLAAKLNPSVFASAVETFALDDKGDAAFDKWLGKMAEWGKKVTEADLKLNDVRWGIIASFKTDEDFTAWLNDLKEEHTAAEKASLKSGTFRPDTEGVSSHEKVPFGAH